MNEAIKMQISAFVDGELPQNEAELLLRRLCQDAELRQQAAEYLAVGRVIRGERTIAGVGMLRERIMATIDDKELQQEFETTQSAAPKFVRPVAGVAIAATVALVALLGLQQISDVPESTEVSSETVAGAQGDSYVVPEREVDPMVDYYLSHSASSALIGADSINTRLVTLQMREEIELDTEAAEVADEEIEDTELEDSVSEESADAPTL